jgi:hypothetical protein
LKTSWSEVRTQWVALQGRFHRFGENDNEVSRWFGWGPVSWCAETVSYMFWLACKANSEDSPFLDTQTAKGTAYSGHFTEWARAGKYGLRFSEEPVVGSIVVYQWDTGMTDHVGMVDSIQGGPQVNFTAWEGNTRSDSVELVQRNNRSGYVVGFAVPTYGPGAAKPPAPSGPAWPGRILGLTTPLTRGEDVRRYQQRLKDRGWRIEADGIFGGETDRITRQFQTEKGLVRDGQVGAATWQAAFRSDNVTP